MVPSDSGETETPDMLAIRTQLEYYFSDSNLPRDKFLLAKTEENEEGYVPIPILLSFKRLQNLGANVHNVIEAVKPSTLLGLDKTHTSVRRVIPLPEINMFSQRAVFVKGWTAGDQEPTLEYFQTLFSPSGKVLSVRVRRWKDDKGSHFKGSVFVEMESAEAVERVVAEDYSIKIEDADGNEVEKQLLVLPVDEYFVQKRKEKEEYRKRKNKERSEKKRSNMNGKSDPEAKSNAESVEKTEKAANKPQKSESERKVVPGLILKFEGFGAEVSREDIREAFEPHAEVAWVDFRRGDSEGHIRFANEGGAKIAYNAMVESKMEFGGKLPTFLVLEDEAEQLYWKRLWVQKEANFQNSKKRRREYGRGSGRGNKRFRGSGRGRHSHRGEAKP